MGDDDDSDIEMVTDIDHILIEEVEAILIHTGNGFI